MKYGSACRGTATSSGAEEIHRDMPAKTDATKPRSSRRCCRHMTQWVLRKSGGIRKQNALSRPSCKGWSRRTLALVTISAWKEKFEARASPRGRIALRRGYPRWTRPSLLSHGKFPSVFGACDKKRSTNNKPTRPAIDATTRMRLGYQAHPKALTWSKQRSRQATSSLWTPTVLCTWIEIEIVVPILRSTYGHRSYSAARPPPKQKQPKHKHSTPLAHPDGYGMQEFKLYQEAQSG